MLPENNRTHRATIGFAGLEYLDLRSCVKVINSDKSIEPPIANSEESGEKATPVVASNPGP